MNEIIAVGVIFLIFIYGYILMRNLDGFLVKNAKKLNQKITQQSPSYVMLTGELTLDEITEEIRNFKEKHEDVRILLYDSSDMDTSETIYCLKGDKG